MATTPLDPSGLNQSGPLPAAALPRRFRPRTVLVPITFMVLHLVVINVATVLYFLVLAIIQGTTGTLDLAGLANLLDQAALEQLILQEYPRIAAISSLALIPIYWIFLKLEQRRDSRSLWLARPRQADLLPALAMIIGALGFTNLWFKFLSYLSESQPLINNLVTDYAKQAGAFTPKIGYFWLIIGISILAPIGEELLFRGIVQGELRKAMPEWLAVIIQALIFALFHMQPIQISYVILPALLLGAAYAWTRSLWVPIIMHITFNFLGSALPTWLGEESFLANLLGIVEIAFIAVGLLAAIFLALRSRHQNRLLKPEFTSDGSDNQ
jgi:membrane protease YdiL (CAAX protease family)